MNEWSDNEISTLIHRLLSDKYIFQYNEKTYYQKTANIALKVAADLHYLKIKDQYLYDDSFFSEEAILNLLYSHNIISKNYQKEIKLLDKATDDLKVKLYKKFRDTQYREAIKEEIKLSKVNHDNLLRKRHSLDFLSLEYFANKAKIEFILAHTIYEYNTDKLVFDINDIDYEELCKVASIMDNELKSLTTIKAICRTAQWKNLWMANSTNVFNVSSSDLSDEQKAVISVCKMYDNIAEHPDCPSEDIIADDDALDGWLIYEKRKNLREKKQKSVNETLGQSGKNHGEVFVMTHGSEEIEEVMNLNDDSSIAIIESRNRTIKNNKGQPVVDKQFSDVKNQLMNEIKKLNEQ